MTSATDADDALPVFHGDAQVGELTRDGEAVLRFRYAPDWLSDGFSIR